MRSFYVGRTHPKLAKLCNWLTWFMDEEALTIGPWIFYWVANPPPDLVVHEEYHVRRQQQLGYVWYAIRYAWLSVSADVAARAVFVGARVEF